MSRSKSCIIILKPTSFFTSFVADQLPDFDCPYEEDLESDCTAYTIPACDDDEVLLEHLERLSPFMFRHETERLLGKNLAAKIKADFLDFLFTHPSRSSNQDSCITVLYRRSAQW